MSSNLEEIYRIHHPAGYLEISEDPDGLGMIQIRWWESHDGKYTHSVTVPAEMADDLITAVTKIYQRVVAK